MRSAHIKNVKREIRQDTQSLKQLNTGPNYCRLRVVHFGAARKPADSPQFA